MPVRKLTRTEFHHRLRRIAENGAGDVPPSAAERVGVPVAHALVGAAAAPPLIAAMGRPLPGGLAPALPEAVLAAWLGAAVVLLSWHAARIVLRRDAAVPRSAAFLSGAMLGAALLILADPDTGDALRAVPRTLDTVGRDMMHRMTGVLPGTARP